jgi:hypothetical protein
MRDKGRIYVGLALFLVVVTFPFWNRLAHAGEIARPELALPSDATECVEDTEYMTANHMDLLNQWRDAVVREGGRDYTSASGRVYTMSLTGTCLDCHGDREDFCTRCHDYSNVEPPCWVCHVEPEGS